MLQLISWATGLRVSSQTVPPQSQSPMPESIPKAAKAKEAAIKKEDALQRAVEEFQQTWSLPSAPSQVLLAMKHGISRSTLQAWISGRTSKIESAGQQQKIRPDEEQLLVDYLQETACWGFPDTLKRATRHANEILHMRSVAKGKCKVMMRSATKVSK